jgi:hypothetical protein
MGNHDKQWQQGMLGCYTQVAICAFHAYCAPSFPLAQNASISIVCILFYFLDYSMLNTKTKHTNKGKPKNITSAVGTEMCASTTVSSHRTGRRC